MTAMSSRRARPMQRRRPRLPTTEPHRILRACQIARLRRRLRIPRSRLLPLSRRTGIARNTAPILCVAMPHRRQHRLLHQARPTRRTRDRPRTRRNQTRAMQRHRKLRQTHEQQATALRRRLRRRQTAAPLRRQTLRRPQRRYRPRLPFPLLPRHPARCPPFRRQRHQAASR